jgi:hypothetical protein
VALSSQGFLESRLYAESILLTFSRRRLLLRRFCL